MTSTIKRPSPKHSLWAIVHHYDNESCCYHAWSIASPIEKKAIEVLEIDFEPEKEEWIEVFKVDLSYIPIIN